MSAGSLLLDRLSSGTKICSAAWQPGCCDITTWLVDSGPHIRGAVAFTFKEWCVLTNSKEIRQHNSCRHRSWASSQESLPRRHMVRSASAKRHLSMHSVLGLRSLRYLVCAAGTLCGAAATSEAVRQSGSSKGRARRRCQAGAGSGCGGPHDGADACAFGLRGLGLHHGEGLDAVCT